MVLKSTKRVKEMFSENPAAIANNKVLSDQSVSLTGPLKKISSSSRSIAPPTEDLADG
ncbi:MAG: hypothetical protein NTNFB01_04290 [Nitrospira sp.]|jgi:hypothetical protein